MFSSCAKSNINISKNDKPVIVATIFPQYDFLREIAKDKADIYMLLPPGSESHHFEPSPSDILNISKCDLFVYAGGNVDNWSEKILSSDEMRGKKSLALTDMVTLLCEEHHHGHDHSKEHHHSEFDEHIWTSPVNAVKICNALCEALCEIDSDNSRYYRQNADEYIQKLYELHNTAKEITDNARIKEVVFADRFPIRYFTEEYGLNHTAAFPGCASETEPGPQTLVKLIDKVRDNEIKAVFYQEFSNQKIADLVCESTNAKKLLFHSCHNLSAEEFDNGENYLSLMTKNIINLKEALN